MSDRSPTLVTSATSSQALDALIARAERRLIDNEAALGHAIGGLVREASARRRTLLPAAAGLVLAWLAWRFRQRRRAQHVNESR